MSYKVMEMQFSPEVALAQVALDLYKIAAKLQRQLFSYVLPAPIANTGLVIQGDGTTHGLLVTAHGITLRGRIDHVWMDQGSGRKRLAGRIQFFRQSNDNKDGQVLWVILFDEIGNVKLGSNSSFSDTINSESDLATREEALRKVALGLITAIHDTLDTISG